MFNAPVYFEENVTSTMDVSRMLATKGEPHGTVIYADFQENGRGRIQERKWQAESGKSLLFTVLLRYPRIEDIPQALTLRAGLAVSLAIEEFTPSLKSKIKIKWPNDIMISEQLAISIEPKVREQCKTRFKKVAGILCEADGGIVHVGIGINVAQKELPPELQGKSTSIALAAGINIEPEKRADLLKIILTYLYKELETSDWKLRLEKQLYKIGERVTFIDGPADSGKEINGTLTGIGDNGELLIDDKAYITGELNFAPLREVLNKTYNYVIIPS